MSQSQPPSELANVDIARVFQLAVLYPTTRTTHFEAAVVPDWWTPEIGVIQDRQISITSAGLLDFIEGDAKEVWNGNQDLLITSNMLEFAVPTGSSIVVQAIAVQQDQQNCLLIRNINVMDSWLRSTLQQARNKLLDHEKVRTEFRREVSTIAADRDEAVRMERMKSEFLANMSHEIRTPLTTILGMASMAQSAGDPSAQQKYLDAIANAANRLLRLGNEILDLSRIQAERLELDQSPFSIAQVMSDFEIEWQLHAKQRALSFQLTVDPDTPEFVVGDSFRLRQVLNNLVGNAMKFTDEGGVSVFIKPSETKHKLLFQVRDTGIGISEEQKARIFDSFTQVDESTRRRHQGAGLGLAIATNLVHLMEGEIHVDSTLGHGSCFSFEALLPRVDAMPVEGTETKSPPVSTRDETFDLRVLVAEDHELNRSIIVETLQDEGFHTVEAENGQAAIEAWRSQCFDAVLMDCQMPIISGLDAIKVIREEEDASRRTPIIALTAHAMQEDRQRLLGLGADEYLAKPFERTDLVNLILKVAKAN